MKWRGWPQNTQGGVKNIWVNMIKIAKITVGSVYVLKRVSVVNAVTSDFLLKMQERKLTNVLWPIFRKIGHPWIAKGMTTNGIYRYRQYWQIPTSFTAFQILLHEESAINLQQLDFNNQWRFLQTTETQSK